MSRSPRSVLADRASDVRDEVSEALEHLVAAVTEGASEVGDRSRRAGMTARERAAAVALALRGERQPQPWQWLLAGLAIGLVIGAMAGATLSRGEPMPIADIPAEPDLPATDG